MKYLKLFCLAVLATFALSACFSASAADLPMSFKATTTNGTQVTITPHTVASFECVGGQVNTARFDTDPKYYVDAGLCAKLKAMPNFAANWVQQPGTERYFQVAWNSMQCSSAGTQVTYSATFPALGDGCQLDSLVKAKSN